MTDTTSNNNTNDTRIAIDIENYISVPWWGQDYITYKWDKDVEAQRVLRKKIKELIGD